MTSVKPAKPVDLTLAKALSNCAISLGRPLIGKDVRSKRGNASLSYQASEKVEELINPVLDRLAEAITNVENDPEQMEAQKDTINNCISVIETLAAHDPSVLDKLNEQEAVQLVEDAAAVCKDEDDIVTNADDLKVLLSGDTEKIEEVKKVKEIEKE